MSMLLSVLKTVFNLVYIQISKFFTGLTNWQTNKLTDGQNQLLNPFKHAHAGSNYINICPSTI